jgi:hypothetical protein
LSFESFATNYHPVVLQQIQPIKKQEFNVRGFDIHIMVDYSSPQFTFSNLGDPMDASTPERKRLGKLGGSELGSLTQSARIKDLRSARNTLIAIGILTILANVALYFLAENMIDNALKAEMAKAGPGAFIKQDIREHLIRLAHVSSVISAFLGLNSSPLKS